MTRCSTLQTQEQENMSKDTDFCHLQEIDPMSKGKLIEDSSKDRIRCYKNYF